jgi:hypothetical protein
MNNPRYYFYIPKTTGYKRDAFWTFGNFPKTLDEYYKNPFSHACISAWILQTYLHLKESGFTCELVHNLPEEGIVVAFCDSLLNLKPGPRQLFVSIRADRHYKQPFAQVHVFQNKKDRLRHCSSLRRLFHPGLFCYMPHWPQPNLIPRDTKRGDRFENVAFFGLSANLAGELRTMAWNQNLQSLGLKWYIVEAKERWNDYSKVDVVLAVRGFNRKRYLDKPASKLYNAWRAGVPAILGSESAFQGERKSKLDYIEVKSTAEILSALKRLKEDAEYRKAIVENGFIQAAKISNEAMIIRWRKLFLEVIGPAYENWCLLPAIKKREYFIRRYFSYSLYRIYKTPRLIRTRLAVRTRVRAMISRVHSVYVDTSKK